MQISQPTLDIQSFSQDGHVGKPAHWVGRIAHCFGYHFTNRIFIFKIKIDVQQCKLFRFIWNTKMQRKVKKEYVWASAIELNPQIGDVKIPTPFGKGGVVTPPPPPPGIWNCMELYPNSYVCLIPCPIPYKYIPNSWHLHPRNIL